MDNKRQNWRKGANLDLSDRPWKMTFKAIPSNPALGSWLVPSLVHAKIEKNWMTSFWEKLSKVQKGHNFDLSTFKKQPLERVDQILIMICC